MKKILQVCVDLDGGGIDRYLYNYCTKIDDIHFDFVKVDRGIVGYLEPLLTERGCKIYKVPRQNGNIVANYKTLRDIISHGHYDAVHVHLGYMSFLALCCAKRCGIKTRIAHAHIAYEPESTVTRIKRFFFTLFTKITATNLAACGIDAGIWMWGKHLYDNGKIQVVNNSIDTELYRYKYEIRKQLRQSFGIKDTTIVLGNVGRIGYQKNQLRLLGIFAEFIKKHRDAQLWLIGNMEYPQDVWNAKMNQLQITNNVKLFGVRKDVASLLNAMDVFVFPSKYEGLPFTLVETQCNGLPCVCSDTVTQYVKVTEEISYLSLMETNEVWSDEIYKHAIKGHVKDDHILVSDAGYNIITEAKKLREYYLRSILDK